MPIAIDEAKKAEDRGEVPVGALIEIDGKVISSAGNRTRELKDPTAHALLYQSINVYKVQQWRQDTTLPYPVLDREPFT